MSQFKVKKLILTSISCFFLLISSTANALSLGAGVSPQKAQELLTQIEKNAKSTNSPVLKAIGEKDVDYIGMTKLPGIYLIAAKNYSVFAFSDESLQNVIIGSYHELQKNGDVANISASLGNNRKFDPSYLEAARANAIIRSVGSPSTKIYIFSDADCSHCAKLNSEIVAKLENVEILIYPIAVLNPNSSKQRATSSLLCTPEIQQYPLWSEVLSGQTPNLQSQSCAKSSALVANTKLSKDLGIKNYPAVIFSNGKIITGDQDPKQFVEKLIDSMKK